MRSRRTKVIPRTARGWTRPCPSGRTFRAFRGRMWFAGVSGGTVKFSEPSGRYWIGVDRGTIDYSAEVTYTNTVGGVSVESIRRFLEAQSPSAQTTTLDGRPYVDAPKRTKLVGGLEKRGRP